MSTSKRNRYRVGPYYVIETDNGFLAQQLHNPPYRNKKTDKEGRVSLFTRPFEVYDSHYKNDYNDPKEPWKPCVKVKYSYAGIIKRRSLESINGIVEKINNGEWTNSKKRFPNPRVIYVEDSIKQYLKRRELAILNPTAVDYTIWEW